MKHRNGYVLLMVLVLLIIIATVLTSIATRSMRTSHDAFIAVTQLQQRVGIASCRAAILEKAFFVFKDLDNQRLSGELPTSVEANYIVSESVELSGQRFDLVLSDENAKVSLNAMHFHAGREKVFQTLRRKLPVEYVRAIRLQPAASANRSRVLPSPDTTESSSTSSEDLEESTLSSDNAIEPEQENAHYIEMIPAFRSWGEVLDFEGLLAQSSVRRGPMEYTKAFTLWGSGQLNVLRALDSSILTQMETVLPAAKAKVILNEIRQAGDLNMQSILEKKVASPRQRNRLQALLGKDSYAFSLFIDVDTPQARSRKLYTVAPDVNGTQEIQEFAFQ